MLKERTRREVMEGGGEEFRGHSLILERNAK
jgi:hypothetical protein